MPGAFDWSPVVKYVCELEGNRDTWPRRRSAQGAPSRGASSVTSCKRGPWSPRSCRPPPAPAPACVPRLPARRPAPPREPAPARGPSGAQRELPDLLLHGGGQEVPGSVPE